MLTGNSAKPKFLFALNWSALSWLVRGFAFSGARPVTAFAMTESLDLSQPLSAQARLFLTRDHHTAYIFSEFSCAQNQCLVFFKIKSTVIALFVFEVDCFCFKNDWGLSRGLRAQLGSWALSALPAADGLWLPAPRPPPRRHRGCLSEEGYSIESKGWTAKICSVAA